MKKELLRHINILKTIPEIEESIEELKPGCKFIFDEKMLDSIIEGELIIAGIEYDSECEDYGVSQDFLYKIFIIEKNLLCNNGGSFVKTIDLEGEEIIDALRIYYKNIEIIGQVSERHLRMFIKSKEIKGIATYQDGEIIYFKSTRYEDKVVGRLDNTKPYMEQSEEFFKKLNDWLILEFNSKLGK